ncbi:MAG: alpha/beta hydrolase [Phycisphaerae bacterium]|nr:alpha/beta hydrolase [Phycisphaerae bacterium]
MGRPTLLMIHGLVGSQHFYDPQARLTRVTVITEDLLGYGRHVEVPADRLTLSAQADHVARRIDELPGEKLWLLGHSMGGAVAVLAADQRLERVCGIINVEGNLTEKDTFWSRKIADQTPDTWARNYRDMQDDPAGWLRRCDIEPTPRQIAWARHILANQPASTVYAMSKALLAETLCPGYLDTVRRLLNARLPMHLVAGEKSAADWGVPSFVLEAASCYVKQPGVGHIMMLEDPDAFCNIVAAIMNGVTV